MYILISEQKSKKTKTPWTKRGEHRLNSRLDNANTVKEGKGKKGQTLKWQGFEKDPVWIENIQRHGQNDKQMEQIKKKRKKTRKKNGKTRSTKGRTWTRIEVSQ